MAYEAFSTEKVFNNELANIICNKILDNLDNNFENGSTKLVTNHSLAKILQGDPLEELSAVSFATKSSDVYDYLVKNLNNVISLNTLLAFQNRIQVETNVCFIEFWFEPAMGEPVMVNGIACRDINELNA